MKDHKAQTPPNAQTVPRAEYKYMAAKYKYMAAKYKYMAAKYERIAAKYSGEQDVIGKQTETIRPYAY